MKRFLYFFCILTLIAGFVSSCSKDEESDNNKGEGGNSVQKRLVKEVQADGEGGEISKFEYDNQGRCVLITECYEDGEIFKLTHIRYEDNKIIEKYETGGGYLLCEMTSILNSRGFIESMKGVGYFPYTAEFKYEYEYDNLGQLISQLRYDKENGNWDETLLTKYEWENGNIHKIVEGNRETIFKYTDELHPTPIENKAKLHIETFGYLGTSIPYSKFGTPNKYFPVSSVFVGEEGDVYEDYKYTLDEDGYPIKLVSKEYELYKSQITEWIWE